MARQTSRSLLLLSCIAGGIGFVALVALAGAGGVTVSPTAFLAGVVVVGAAILLARAFRRGGASDTTPPPAADDPDLRELVQRPGDIDRRSRSGEDRPGYVPVAGASRAPGESIDRALDVDATDPAGGRPGDTGGSPDPAAPDMATVEETGAGESLVEPPHPMATRDAAGEAAQPKWRSSQLPGSQELARRKGTWRYAPDGSRADTETAREEARDAEIGVEPERLSGPREGSGDNLKRISGVGPKLEEMLHGLGIYHFDQIARWNDREAAWIDERLTGFKGRVRRDEWVRQARDLASGARG